MTLAPPRPTWSALLGDWSLDPLFVLTVRAGVLYVAGRAAALRAGSALAAGAVGRRSPSACVLVLLATQSGLAQYDRVLFSLHVVQHLLLGMVAPLFLVLGAPVTLALQASRRPAQQRLLRVLHSRPVLVVTHPARGLGALRRHARRPLLHRPLRAVAAQRRGCTRSSTRTSSSSASCSWDTWSAIDPLRAGLRLRRPACSSCSCCCRSTRSSASRCSGSDRVLASGWYSQVVALVGIVAARRPEARRRDPLGRRRAVRVPSRSAIVLFQWMRHEEREGARLDRRLDAERVGVPH